MSSLQFALSILSTVAFATTEVRDYKFQADEIEHADKAKIVTLKGHAKVIHGENTLTCEEITIDIPAGSILGSGNCTLKNTLTTTKDAAMNFKVQDGKWMPVRKKV